MINLTPCQYKAVKQLYNQLMVEKANEIWFKAPTGAGKTFIIANLINEIFETEGNLQKSAVIYLTLSKGSLPEQVNQKFNYVYKLFKSHFIQAPSDAKAKKSIDSNFALPLAKKQHEVFVIGGQTLTQKSILIETYEFRNFIISLQQQKYNLYLIWDEAHIGSGSINKKHCQTIINDIFGDNNYQMVKLTATLPEHWNKNVPLISINKEDAEADFLIKTNINPLIRKYVNYDYNNLLNLALEKLKYVQGEYSKSNIRPALLIQIQSKNAKSNNTDNFSLEENKYIKEIKYLIEKKGFNWFLWLSNRKETNLRQYDSVNLSQNNSDVDVIIFKQALTTGWDIPRACILLQLREIHSDTLKNQVVGRIKRNPLYPLSEIDKDKNKIFKNYWILSNNREDSYWEPPTLILKPEYEKEKFHSLKANRQLIKRGKREQLFKYLKDNEKEIKSKIIDYYKDLSIKNRQNPEIEWEKISFSNRNNITKKINNLFDLLQLWNQKWVGNESIQKQLEKWIIENCNFKLVNKHYANENIKYWEWYLYFLDLKNQINFKKICDSYNKKFLDQKIMNENQHEQLELFQLIPSSSLPKSIINKGSEKLQLQKKWIKFFPYLDKNTMDHINPPEIQLDSLAEVTFIQKLFKYLDNHENDFSEIKVATKHFLPSEIYYEKIDESISLGKTYPDVFVKLKINNITYTFVIEIKNKNYDYDEGKTQDLVKQYKFFAKQLANENYIFVVANHTINDSNNEYHCYYRNYYNKGRGSTITDIFNIIKMLK